MKLHLNTISDIMLYIVVKILLQISNTLITLYTAVVLNIPNAMTFK